MTVIKGVELDDFKYKKNELKLVIKNNDPIENKLHVIVVISNPCLYVIRYIRFKEFIQRIENEETNVILYIVELTYGDQKFVMTDSKNPRHLQINTKVPLWHKENMINIGVKKLLPSNWKAFAWIDADIEFESSTWALDTLKILNGHKDMVQIWSHCVDMDNEGLTMKIFNSGGYQYYKGHQYSGSGINYWHPGYAWAITRKAYERIGGIYDKAILGSGDNIMMLALLGNVIKAITPDSTDGYKQSVIEYEKKISTLRYGYTPGMIYHYFHGSKKNRQYTERWKILSVNNFDPLTFIDYDNNGIIIPTSNLNETLKSGIITYFEERNEDELQKYTQKQIGIFTPLDI
jgi:hypothetical protein